MKKKSPIAWFYFVFVAVLIFASDFWVKKYIISHLPLMKTSLPFYPYGGIGVFYNVGGIDFSIVHVTNRGVAWGFLASMQNYIPFFRILLLIGLSCYLWITRIFFKYPLCFVAIFTGAFCNILDYFLYGHVVDMFHFRFWGYSYPVFNIADSAIFCGVAGIGISSLFLKKSKPVKA